LDRWAREMAVENLVSIEPPVAHEELPGLVRRAKAIVFPSTYESFGLPVLEAMASGTAVVCSDIPAFQELFCPAVEQFRTENAESLAGALDRVLSDDGHRRDLEMRGLRRSERFTWEACAENTLSVYRRLLNL
jgi:alpha-1,3-rhamnosyl/mannosyltransferase